MSRENGWPHARAMGDGSASADLLPEEEVDEDLADGMLHGAVTDAGVEPVDIGEGVHAVGGVERQLIDLAADVFGGLFGGHGSMLAKGPCPPAITLARCRAIQWRSGLLAFRCCAVLFSRRRSIAPRAAWGCAQPATRFGPGMAGGYPHRLGLPPASYKTPPKNTYDPKNPRVGGQKPRAPKSAVIMPRTALGAAA